MEPTELFIKCMLCECKKNPDKKPNFVTAFKNTPQNPINETIIKGVDLAIADKDRLASQSMLTSRLAFRS